MSTGSHGLEALDYGGRLAKRLFVLRTMWLRGTKEVLESHWPQEMWFLIQI